jgi:hypothetical protein
MAKKKPKKDPSGGLDGGKFNQPASGIEIIKPGTPPVEPPKP